MKRLFLIVLSTVLGISLIRIMYDRTPLTLANFLRALSNVDISFENTLEQISSLSDLISFPELSNSSGIFESIGLFFTWIYQLAIGILKVPIDIVKDILDFITSVLTFFQILIT